MGPTTPQFEHDWDCCQFLGRYQHRGIDYDLYFCTEANPPTPIARHGNEGPEYRSGMVFAELGTDPVLVEALKRARAAALLEH